MKELSLKYGINKPFEDDQILDEITAMTYPSVGDFFKKYVIGTTPINYDDFFNKVGLDKVESKVETNYIMNEGALILQPNMETGSIAFNNMVMNNSFWNDLGVLEGDIIIEINGDTVSLQTAQTVFSKVYMWQSGINIEVKLDRNGEEVIIEAETVQSYTTVVNLMVSEDSTETQDKLRNAWLRG